MALASKTLHHDKDGTPYRVIIEDPDTFPFAPGERERDWREATDEEVDEYEALYDALNADD